MGVLRSVVEPRVLVVVADSPLCELVGWILDELEVAHESFARWRQVIAAVEEPPVLAIVDLDDVGKNSAGMVSILLSGWGKPIPFIGLSRSPNVSETGQGLGAVAGLRKPINVGLLMANVIQATKPSAVD